MTAATEVAPAPVDRRGAIKIVVAVVAVAGAIGYLLYSSTRAEAQYYKHVDEVMADPEGLRGKRLRVQGFVVKDSIEREKNTLKYRFKIETRPPQAPAVVTAHFNGIPPDTFKSGAAVIAHGILSPQNEIVADEISAKCPSKYEEDQAKLLAGGGGAPAAP